MSKGKRPNNQKYMEMQLKRQKDKFVKEACITALNALNVIPLYILAVNYGFGRKRGQAFAREFKRLHTAVSKGEVSIDTLKSEVEYKMGIEINTDWSDM